MLLHDGSDRKLKEQVSFCTIRITNHFIMSALSPSEAQLKVDAYLAKMPAFARAICTKLRHIILQADPAIRENWKWSAPVYERNGLVCSYAAFKQHVRFSFFQGAYLADPAQLLTEG